MKNNVEKKSKIILNRYMNQKDLMNELHIGFGTLKELHQKGLNYIRLGKQCLYDLDDVDKILKLSDE